MNSKALMGSAGFGGRTLMGNLALVARVGWSKVTLSQTNASPDR